MRGPPIGDNNSVPTGFVRSRFSQVEKSVCAVAGIAQWKNKTTKDNMILLNNLIVLLVLFLGAPFFILSECGVFVTTESLRFYFKHRSNLDLRYSEAEYVSSSG